MPSPATIYQRIYQILWLDRKAHLISNADISAVSLTFTADSIIAFSKHLNVLRRCYDEFRVRLESVQPEVRATLRPRVFCSARPPTPFPVLNHLKSDHNRQHPALPSLPSCRAQSTVHSAPLSRPQALQYIEAPRPSRTPQQAEVLQQVKARQPTMLLRQIRFRQLVVLLRQVSLLRQARALQLV
jgi:hypothetical protein